MNRFPIKTEMLGDLKGYTVEWAEPHKYVVSRANHLFIINELSEIRRVPPFGQFPANFVKRLGAKNRLGQRLLRFMFYNVICLPNSDRIFVTFRDQVGVFESSGQFREVSGMHEPSKFLRGSCAIDRLGGVYLGEYRSNNSRDEVKIYYLPAGDDRMHVVHTFAPGEVRHVHGLFYDQYEDAIWCTTGDRGSECRIMVSRDGLSTLDIVGAGDESWRAVSLVFDQNGISYGMDAEFHQNKIFHLERNGGRRQEIGEIPGPVYYARTIAGTHLFGVTAEGCPSQQAHNAASLWALKNGALERVVSYDKDMLPNYFMLGTIHFNQGPGYSDNECFCYLNGLKGVDQYTLRLIVP